MDCIRKNRCKSSSHLFDSFSDFVFVSPPITLPSFICNASPSIQAKEVSAKKEAEKQRKAIEKKKLEDRRSGIGFDGHGTSSYSSSSSSSNSPSVGRNNSNYSSAPVVETRK